MEWISVKDKLPESDDTVLVYNYQDGISLGYFDLEKVDGYFDDEGNVIYTADGWCICYPWTPKRGVTHWMALPDAPEEL